MIYIITGIYGRYYNGTLDQGSMTDYKIRKSFVMLFLLHVNFVILVI